MHAWQMRVTSSNAMVLDLVGVMATVLVLPFCQHCGVLLLCVWSLAGFTGNAVKMSKIKTIKERVKKDVELPYTGVSAGKLTPHMVRVAFVVVEHDAPELGGVGGAGAFGSRHGLSRERHHGRRLAEPQALAEDFGGHKAGGAGNDEFHLFSVYAGGLTGVWRSSC